ncbi:MAG: hypothetical protein J7J86_09470 [Bacteroidales bacterium]|nr:hypothetical protein [Bacteroidales bacterium]
MKHLKHIIISFFVFSISLSFGTEVNDTISNDTTDFQEELLRVETGLKTRNDKFRVIPFGEKGVLQFCRSGESEHSKQKMWSLKFYNINLKEIWSKEIIIDKRMDFKGMDTDDNNLYILLFDEHFKKSKNNIQIISLNIIERKVTSLNTKISEEVIIDYFKVYNKKAFLGGKIKPSTSSRILQGFLTFTLLPAITGINVVKYQPALFKIDLNTATNEKISKKFKGQTFVQSMQKSVHDKNMYVVYKNFIPKDKNALYINTFSKNVNNYEEIKLTSSDNKRKLNYAKILTLDSDKKIIIGTYNNAVKGKKANPVFNDFQEESVGLFITTLDNDKPQYLNFYNFSELKNFYNNYSKNRALKIKGRAKSKKAKGKELSYDYKLLIHDIVQNNDKFYLLLELYYPEYHTETYYYYDYYGRPNTRYYTVFDGYNYTNAIITCFDKAGNLLWDDSFNMQNITSFDLQKRVELFFDDNIPILVYAYNKSIFYKIISNDPEIQDQGQTNIENLYENDKVLSDYNDNIKYWYKNYFITSGYQKIKNRNYKGKTRRTVFYLNKISFE